MAPTLTDPMHGFFASHSPVLLSVGGLEPEYDVGLQIEVVERLRTRFPSVGLVMIGSGSLEEQLRARIEESSARDHLLLAGDVSHPQTLRAINESHVLLRTTWYDGDAISVREALFLQAPVIATDNGMRPPRVHLIPKQDADALENAIVGVLASDRKGGAQQELSGRENLDAVFELYRELAPISSAR
ncbi:MAG: glycosyltransferase [Gemmatimonadaceae bacterium]